LCAQDNDLLYEPGWGKYWKTAKREKVLKRQLHQAKLKSYCTTPRYKYGFEVPRDYNHAMELDKKNGNTKWHDATVLEVTLLDEYTVHSLTKDRAKRFHLDIKRFGYILSSTSSMMDDTAHGWSPTDILPTSPSTVSTLELYLFGD
jgi:hypothetical protein